MTSRVAQMLLWSVALTVLLTACGQKGPLYLPKEPAPPASTPAENPPPKP